MACGSSSAIVPRKERTPIDGCQLPRFFQWRSEIDARHGAVHDPSSANLRCFAELKRWQPLPIHVVLDDNFDDWLVRADVGQEFGHYRTRRQPLNGLRRRSRKSARPNSSSTSLTEKRAERVLQKAGPPDCSGDDPAGSGRRPVITPSCCRHARGSMPAVEAEASHRTCAQSPGRGARASVSVCFGWRTAAAVPVRRRCRP